MIHHIFKIIWNERRTNLWLIGEFVLVFAVLWFCADFLFFMGSRKVENPGYDMSHVYTIAMGEKPKVEGEDHSADQQFAEAMTFLDRMKGYPGVEAVGFSRAALPYGGGMWSSGYRVESDTVTTPFRMRWATPGYFDVFKIKLTNGKMYDWPNEATENQIIISPNRQGVIGQEVLHNPNEIHQLIRLNEPKTDSVLHVVGTTGRLKAQYFQDFSTGVIFPLPKKDITLSNPNQVTIRVSPDADNHFVEKFTKEMKDQLNIGPYYLISLTSMDQAKTDGLKGWGITSQLNGISSITVFLIINIFLGILGTFWFRTQARQSEIGLRIALGASKTKVKNMMLIESLLLLSISAILGTIICINIGNAGLHQTLGMPDMKYWKSEEGFSLIDHATNFAITFGFLAIVSIIAVWYPAKQAADTQPAEALHAE